MYKIGDKVKLKFNWFQIAKHRFSSDIIYHWKNNGIKDFLNTCIGKEMTIINKLGDSYDLDDGDGFNFREDWLVLTKRGEIDE